jgi:hypothetical protein
LKTHNLVRSLKRKVPRTIFGPVLENGYRRKNKNSEIYKLYDEHDVVKFIKFGRLMWAGHVMRKEVTLQRMSFVPNQKEMETGAADQR